MLPGLGLVPGIALELVTRGVYVVAIGEKKAWCKQAARDYIEARGGPRSTCNIIPRYALIGGPANMCTALPSAVRVGLVGASGSLEEAMMCDAPKGPH